LAFRIEGTPPKLIWEDKPVTYNADAAMHEEAKIETDSPQVAEAIEWLKHELAEGERSAAELKKESNDAGIGIHSLRQAAVKLGVKKSKAGYKGNWVWILESK
jgi:hypothetical protein